MQTRRAFVGTAGVGAVTLAAAPGKTAPGQAPAAPRPADLPAGVERRLAVVSLGDVEAEARGALSAGAWAFVADGSGDGWTLAENRRAFTDVAILPRRLQGIDAGSISLGTRLLGEELPHPILVAPSGLHVFVHPEAERVTAGGAGRAGALYTASGASSLPLEQIASATSGPKWFQTYLNADEGVTKDVLIRAKTAGFSAIVLTADAIGPGSGDAFIRLGRPFPPGTTFGNHDPRYGGRGDFLKQKTAIGFDDIGMIRATTGLPVVVKGLLRKADATDAIAAGAAAIQVSNHGGRQIDGVPASISVLAEIVDAVGGRVPIIFDGGVRRGIDVFKALALGATAVATARPILYGAALGGSLGVAAVLEHLRDELRVAMLLSGAQSIAKIGRDAVRIRNG